MKSQAKYITAMLLTFVLGAFLSTVHAQERNDIQYYTPPTQAGLNEFESPFTTDKEFQGFQVRIGGANTLQFQGISHDNDAGDLADLENNFNLATSNLDLDVALAPGMRMHLRTYLSSQHHTETYVKGGYLQIDSFDFIEEGFLAGLSDHVRIKVGHMENNYGDNHFRRSDNGATINNPFVGNYIMDSFTTEVGGEVYVYSGDVFGMVGLTNGKLNQSTVEGDIKTKPSFLAKVGYDSQVNEDLRVRLTGSIFRVGQNSSIYLYSGDRAGSRYYNVIEPGNFRAGRYAPTFTPPRGSAPAAGEMTAIMINPFVKYQGLEFYGVFENVSGQIETESSSRSFTQLGAELLYRFGAAEDFYVGGRYNSVSGEELGGNDISISRVNIGGGWFMTENVLTKLEYVTQSYDDFTGTYAGAEFSGIMLEAVISF
ncbi:hypothetical protein [Gracilimonas mengyeensis]|uniref:Phosphate-selective porin O and P n=1 Tax=Gracilimonas mengyeensis TaxID=1302730 RepID=A0A521EA37_9BACT|nr:hypothetical protein [Gracilimonas mengyeensis]SMO80784.1 hypothetical protein SAMN06265219_11162 [Gracilimonas mengyeensis]